MSSDDANMHESHTEYKYSVTLSVFFCGTSGSIIAQTTQIGNFSNSTQAEDVTDFLPQKISEGSHFKMSFDGCGVAYGCRGSLFAHGLNEQCQKVINRIKEIFDKNHTVRLNVLGLSRGGIATMKLIQRLRKYDLRELRINACLFDPVPGNLLTTTKLFDHCGLTVAKKSMDLSKSKNLCSVLALYPHEPLPDLAFHAPIIPKYPSNAWCEVEEDVVLGCHQGALWNSIDPYRDLASTLSYIRIYQFLTRHGSVISEQNNIDALERSCLEYIQREMNNSYSTNRPAHSYIGKTIVRCNIGEYLNKHHMQLMEISSNDQNPILMLQIQNKPFIPYHAIICAIVTILIVVTTMYLKR